LFVGKCNETSNTTFICLCEFGWEGNYCERKVNYCQNITCQNKAVCRPLFLNYACECLSDSFSGRHCEIVANKLIIRQIVAKSFGYIGYLSIISLIMFVIIMDILKYCFGIDPTSKYKKTIQQKKQIKKVKRRPVIQRFVYVNALPSKKSITTIEETNV
jgi:hypothetical protein